MTTQTTSLVRVLLKTLIAIPMLFALLVAFAFAWRWVSQSAGMRLAGQEMFARETVMDASAPKEARVAVAQLAQADPPARTATPVTAIEAKLAIEVDDKDLEFDRQARELARQLRTAKPDDQPRLRRELEALNEQHFEYRQQQRKAEIERLSGRVDALRLLHLRRQENKAKILERRMLELANPDTDSEWTDDEIISARQSGQKETRESSPAAETSVSEKKPTQPKTPEGTYHSQTNAPVPTYQGLSLDQWRVVMETERSPEKLIEAMAALLNLSINEDPRQLVQAIIQMSRTRAIGEASSGVEGKFLDTTTRFLRQLPPKIVLDEIALELEGPSSQHPSPGFQSLFSGLVNSLMPYHVRYSQTTAPFRDQRFANGQYKSIEAFITEIRRRSRRFVSLLAAVAQNDNELDDWVFQTTRNIMWLSKQPISTYPEMIPVAQRVFANPTAPARNSAADVLGESGLNIGEVLTYYETELKDIHLQSLGSNFEADIERIGKRISILFPYAQKEVLRIINERWQEFETSPKTEDGGLSRIKCLKLIFGLTNVGDPAKDAIPTLRAIERSELCNAQTREVINDAIKKIEEAKSKPQPEPLPEDDSPTTTSHASTVMIQQIVGANKKMPLIQPPTETTATEEQTFDGTPYSQWLRMLETERKPQKLAAAMEACSRLAAKSDERRIARRIFFAASLFEAGDAQERSIVSSAGWTALRRLAADAVLDELLIALRDQDHYRNRREFQTTSLKTGPAILPTDFLEKHANEIIGELLKLIVAYDSDADSLLAAASSLWRSASEPSSNDEVLTPLMIKMLEESSIVPASLRKKPQGSPMMQGGMMGGGGGMFGGGMGGGGMAAAGIGAISERVKALEKQANENVSQFVSFDYRIVARNVVQKAPDTPGLALMLMKHAQNNIEDFRLIGKLGPRAVPAVPLLVDRFVRLWELYEVPNLNAQNPQLSNQVFFGCPEIIKSLGQIGDGEKGYPLLRQLCLISPSRNSGNDGALFGAAKQAMREFKVTTPTEGSLVLLDDKSLIQGKWNLQIRDPQQKFWVIFRRDNLELEVRQEDGRLLTMNDIDGFNIGEDRWEIDATVTPKQITLKADDSAPTHNGIYELTETTLRIQLAEIGKPRPTELVKDKANLPQGQLLLELDRSLQEILEQTKKDE